MTAVRLRLGAAPCGLAQRAATAATEAGDDVPAALRLCAALSSEAPVPGGGRTLERWELLAGIAASDLTAARVVEAHLDAVAILTEAGLVDAAPAGSTWGVYAAEGPGTRLTAARDDDGGWALDGVKPWCSLAGSLSHALVTAHVPDGRALFAVDLRSAGVGVDDGAWHARGLANVPSGPVTFDRTPATPVGGTDWYLHRPGFAHGGIGVAACWYGGAVALARQVAQAARDRQPDDLALWHLGELDLALHRARTALVEGAAAVDAGDAVGSAGAILAQRVRGVVAASAEQVLERVGHALGPAPLALDERHARRVADLTLYLRQHHAERDALSLGRALTEPGAEQPW